MRRAIGLAAAVALVWSGCGHSRPTAAERLPLPLVPAALPAGYVLIRVDERVGGHSLANARASAGEGGSPVAGGRWVDFTFMPQDAKPQEVERAVSLHQFLDVEAATTSVANGDRRLSVRGRPGVCSTGGVLRWSERRAAQVTLGGGDLRCEDLQRIAESLREVDEATWLQYRRTARDQ